MNTVATQKNAVAFAALATVAVTGAVILGDGWRESCMFALGAVWALSIGLAWVFWKA